VLTAETLFGSEQVERGRRYHRPLYLALPVDVALGLGTLAVLAASPWPGWPWWIGGPLAAVAATAAVALVRLPLSLWRGWARERRWGLSTQPLAGFLADRAKGIGVGAVLAALTVLALEALVRAFPHAWPVAAAVAGAGLVLLLGFVAPVVLEPLFNRFAPLGDEALAAELRALAERAEVPVRDVLVADASRRTAKANAYVSGLGATRRLVLFDTLVDASPPAEIAAVVAHELGHRRARHVAQGTVLGMAGAAIGAVVLWAVLGDRVGEPGDVPLVLLLLSVLELLAAPAGAWLSRRWERAADRFAVRLTRDPAALEAAFRRLGETNVADLDPPRVVRVLLLTHPPLPERIAAIRG
jgi:Zn-dependent protease with chaperone function